MFNNNVFAGQQTQIISVEYDNNTLKEVIKDLKVKTNLTYFYNRNDVDDSYKVSLKLTDATINQVMNAILKNTNLKWELESNVVIIKKSQINVDNNSVAKGKVTDNQGAPLPGVTVIVKNTKTGVATDIDGNFEIRAKKGDVLVVSFVGMITREITYQGKNLVIKMQDDVKTLDEVVVSTGYQKIERRHLTSSVTSVKKEDVIEVGKTSIDNMLQGKIPGLSVINPTSSPGAAPKIRIRGTSTITGNREPIWVVDGVILEDPVQISNEELNSMDRVNFIGNAISFLNPEDIEQIDILKDASATAIYGAKAGNGVIVITTKKGEKGTPVVNYSFSTTITDRPDYSDMHMMNSRQRIEVSEELLEKGISYNGGLPTSIGYERELDRLWKKEISYEDFKANVKNLKEMNTDWYDLLFRTSFSNSHNLSLSGGSDNTTYYFSFGYSDQKGTTLGVNYKKYNASTKINTNLRDNLKFNVSLSAGMTNNKRPHSSVDLYEYAYKTSRSIAPYDTEGNPVYYGKSYTKNQTDPTAKDLGFNIFNELDNSGNEIKNVNLSFRTSLDWKINNNFNFETLFAYNYSSSRTDEYAAAQTYYISAKRGTSYGEMLPNEQENFANEDCEIPYGGEYRLVNTFNKNYTVRNSLSYSKNIDRNHFSANVGFELRSSQYEGNSQVEYGYLPDRGKKFTKILGSKWLAYEGIMNPLALTENTTNFVSYYGTFTYAWNNKYIANFNLRADGSNKFGQDKDARFLPIWSVSGRWNASSEDFMRAFNWLDHLSLHASYGIQGNVHSDQVPSLILQMGDLDVRSNLYVSSLYKFPNNKLKWEKTNSYNAGLDFTVFEGLFSGSVEGYFKKGEDIVVKKDISPTNGATSVALNKGTLENKGIDFSVTSNIIDNKDWSLSFTVNAGKNINKITDSGKKIEYTYKDYIKGRVIQNGKSVNTFYAYQFDGLDANGFPTFKDINEKDGEDHYIDANLEEALNRALIIAGRREPDLTGGFTAYLRYKNFKLNTVFNFNFGNDIRLNGFYSQFGQNIPGPNQNMSTDFVNRWRKPSDELRTNIPVLSNDQMLLRGRKYEIATSYWEMYDNSDYRIASGDFLKCRNISLAYQFDKELYKKIGLTNLSLTAAVDNVFTIADKKLKGRDPEQIDFGSGAVPPMTTFSLRLNASF